MFYKSQTCKLKFTKHVNCNLHVVNWDLQVLQVNFSSETTCEEVESDEPAVEASGRHRMVLLDFHRRFPFAHLTLNEASNKVAHTHRGLNLLLEDKLLLFVENFDISGYHGWFMFLR